jgi:RsiW-degrading membrane proteinase PrsW (M82 family)
MKKVWDRVGSAMSAACVVHCIAVAFLPLLFPVLETYTHKTWIHMVVAVMIMMTSPLAFIPGYRKHGLTWIIGTAFCGLFLILSSIILENHFSDQITHGISIGGSLLLVFAHVKNLQHSHRHHHQCC